MLTPMHNLEPNGRRDGDDIVLQFSGTTIPQFLAFVMNTFQDKQLVDETGLPVVIIDHIDPPTPN